MPFSPFFQHFRQGQGHIFHQPSRIRPSTARFSTYFSRTLRVLFLNLEEPHFPAKVAPRERFTSSLDPIFKPLGTPFSCENSSSKVTIFQLQKGEGTGRQCSIFQLQRASNDQFFQRAGERENADNNFSFCIYLKINTMIRSYSPLALKSTVIISKKLTTSSMISNLTLST